MCPIQAEPVPKPSPKWEVRVPLEEAGRVFIVVRWTPPGRARSHARSYGWVAWLEVEDLIVFRSGTGQATPAAAKAALVEIMRKVADGVWNADVAFPEIDEAELARARQHPALRDIRDDLR